MATSFADLKTILFAEDTLKPQTFSSTAGGTAVDVSTVASPLLTARLRVGAVDTLTSFAVKMQASRDGSTDWDDISGATFTTVTAADAEEMISFQVPKAESTSVEGYKYVRAYGTLSGTSVAVTCVVMGCLRMPNAASGYANSAPTIN